MSTEEKTRKDKEGYGWNGFVNSDSDMYTNCTSFTGYQLGIWNDENISERENVKDSSVQAPLQSTGIETNTGEIVSPSDEKNEEGSDSYQQQHEAKRRDKSFLRFSQTSIPSSYNPPSNIWGYKYETSRYHPSRNRDYYQPDEIIKTNNDQNRQFYTDGYRVEKPITKKHGKDENGGNHNPPVDRRFRRRNLYINFLPSDMNEEKLHELFSPYGSIDSVKIMYNYGLCNGIGFVCFREHEHALNAIHAMNGKKVDQRTLQVEFKTNTKRNRRPFLTRRKSISNLRILKRETDRKYASVPNKSRRSGRKLLENIPVEEDAFQRNKKVEVRGLPTSALEKEELLNMFSVYGKVVDLSLESNEEPICKVEFLFPLGAERAIFHLDKEVVEGKEIRLCYEDIKE